MRSCTRGRRAPRRRGWRPRTTQPATRLRRRVEPGREHGEQRERPVGVVELLARPPVVGEKQQADADLRDEQRLARGSRGATAPRSPRRAKVRDSAPERRADRHRPEPGRQPRVWAASIAATLRGRTDGRRGQAGTRLRGDDGLGRAREALRPSRQAGRPLLLSQGRHARMHHPGVRFPGRLLGVRAARRRRARRQPRRRGLACPLQGEVRASVHAARRPRAPVAEQYGVWGEKNYGARSTWASSARRS